MKIVYFSVTGNTRKYVGKIQEWYKVDALEITAEDPEFAVDEDFLLIVPCYERNTTNPVWEFMSFAGNSQHCQGVIGGGNRNFAGLFIYTAKDIRDDFGVPLLWGFEFAGMPNDVEFVVKWLKEHEE
ncbi:MAG: class Ib ribonucleoside-diphosphate reductase assembly flavoprotein NrdI [Streptococcaceae bacterium]|jgi:protein involved in ribonucleotide reduction|nr:class Ib ribonucleoside-diphosphate reductase assembly flavoprotein NrdI [Streptococcaceae bacterium]